MQNRLVVFIIGLVVGAIVGSVAVNTTAPDEATSERERVALPDSAVQLTECVPGMGFHWADPQTLPAGPVYVLDGENEVIGLEYIITEVELEGDHAGAEQFMPAFDERFSEVSLTYEPEGLGEISAPLYALHLYKLSENERANICEGQTLEEDAHGHDADETSTDEDAHNSSAPEEVADAVRAHASETYDVPEGEVIVMEAHEREWPDGCLGLGGSDEMCTQAIVLGYEVTVNVGDEEYTYRTNEDGSVIRVE